MMKTDQEFSDEELTAYLDGELDHARIDVITKALSRDTHLRDRLEALSINRGDITAAFDQLLLKAPKAALPEARTATKRSWQGLSIAASITCLCIGYLLGIGTGNYSSHQEKGWHEYVAAYQALYINNTLSHVKSPLTLQRSELARVSKVLGKSVILEDINQFPQLDYKRAQILGFQGQPLLQLTFLSTLGEPIALCIIRSSLPASEGVQLANRENMASASWQKEGYGYLLIGGKDALLINDMAEKFFTAL